MARAPKKPKPNLINVVTMGGKPWCIYVNDYRVAGQKPWGGGDTILSLHLDIPSLLEACPDITKEVLTREAKKASEAVEVVA